VLGITTLTGMGFKFSAFVLTLSESFAQTVDALDAFGWFDLKRLTILFGLLFTAIACIIMGAGVPTTPTYIILASIVAPALAQLGVPQIATHFFVFYYGVLADVTPPVALAAYAGAGIAGSEPMRTGLTAFRLSMGKAIVPFMFTYTPALLFIDFAWAPFVSASVAGAIGILALAAAYTRWWAMTITRVEQVVLTAGGLILVFNQFWLNVIGIAVVAITLGMNTLRARR